MPDIYTLGAARVTNPDGTYTSPVCHMTLEVDESSDTREDLGEMPLMFGLGLTALPAAPDENGQAEGVAIEGVGGFNACAVGGRDTRCADVAGKIKPGETCVHNTGGTPETRARALFKENCASIIVGSDLVLMLDRKNSKIQITGFGHIFEMSTAQGIVMGAKGGKNGIQLKEDGSVTIWGTSVNLGGMTTPGTSATSVIMGPSGMAGVPAPNVYITL
jgi:hypothetical protein